MDEKFKKYLPLGSVVLMNGGKKRVMVTGYVVKSPQAEGKIFDYVGCLWPEGVISSDKNLMFNHKDIAQVFAIGYVDEEQKKFMGVLNTATDALHERLAKEMAEQNNSNVNN